MLKSNGYKHPENRLKKFEVSLKITSTNLVKKLPSQTLSQTVSHRNFQLLSQTAHVRSHSRKRVHTRLRSKNRTQGHTRRNRGLPSPGHNVVLYCQRNSFYSTMLLLRLPTTAVCGRRFLFSAGLPPPCHSAVKWPVGFSVHHGRDQRPSTSAPAVRPAAARWRGRGSRARTRRCPWLS